MADERRWKAEADTAASLTANIDSSAPVGARGNGDPFGSTTHTRSCRRDQLSSLRPSDALE